jgi:hypothetical protein
MRRPRPPRGCRTIEKKLFPWPTQKLLWPPKFPPFSCGPLGGHMVRVENHWYRWLISPANQAVFHTHINYHNNVSLSWVATYFMGKAVVPLWFYTETISLSAVLTAARAHLISLKLCRWRCEFSTLQSPGTMKILGWGMIYGPFCFRGKSSSNISESFVRIVTTIVTTICLHNDVLLPCTNACFKCFVKMEIPRMFNKIHTLDQWFPKWAVPPPGGRWN